MSRERASRRELQRHGSFKPRNERFDFGLVADAGDDDLAAAVVPCHGKLLAGVDQAAGFVAALHRRLLGIAVGGGLLLGVLEDGDPASVTPPADCLQAVAAGHLERVHRFKREIRRKRAGGGGLITDRPRGDGWLDLATVELAQEFALGGFRIVLQVLDVVSEVGGHQFVA